jgi:hypothetical protein
VTDMPTGGPGPAGAGGPGPGEPGAAGQPSEEELRAALGQLRGAPVDQVVAEVASALLNAAQVKLGRRDGRLLIDLTAVVTERVRGYVPDDLTRQLDEVLTQLRMAQVEAEREVQAATAQGHEEPNDLTRMPRAPSGRPAEGAETAGEPPPPSAPGQSATSRLWVPGR